MIKKDRQKEINMFKLKRKYSEKDRPGMYWLVPGEGFVHIMTQYK